MRISVRVRTIIVMNLLVIGVAVVLGKIAGEVAGQVVEERMASELASNTSNFLRDRKLPFTDSLMRYLSQMFGVEVATFSSQDGRTVASSLPPGQTEELRRQLSGERSSKLVTLGGQVFHVDSHEIMQPDRPEERGEAMRLCLVVPQKQFQDARDKAMERMTLLALPAVGVATILAFALSVTITRPIRKLAGEMDRLSEEATREAAGGPGDGGTGRSISIRRGPSEVVRLAESFNNLLESLHKVQGQLAQSQRLATLGSVAASVAHELRNPLSGIKMNVRVLRDEVVRGGDDDETLRVILREIDRMDLYLEELLGLAGSPSPGARAADRGQSVRESLSLAELVDSVVVLLEGRCKHEGIELRRELGPVPPVRVDGTKVRQVIMNLVINAIEAMPEGGEVRLGLETAPGGGVRFWVADAGRGVLVNDGADIFEPFVTTKAGSAGLGLHLCRQIIEDHGGKIGYKNSEAGATFWFELPAGGRVARD